MNSWTLSTSCNVVNPGNYSTRIPSVLRQLCPQFCIVVNLWTKPTVFPKQHLMLGSGSSFQGITQNLKIRKPSRARDWWLLHHWPEIFCFHEESSQLIGVTPKISSECPTINFSDMSKLLFHCEIDPCIFDGMPIVWVILLHEYRCFQCRRHKHSPY